jgi:hypothetical protein
MMEGVNNIKFYDHCLIDTISYMIIIYRHDQRTQSFSYNVTNPFRIYRNSELVKETNNARHLIEMAL